jgi:hypothetical protein
MTLKEIHAVLQQAFADVAALHGQMPDGIGVDTAFAIGEALGVISKAKSLVGRDVDDHEQQMRP